MIECTCGNEMTRNEWTWANWACEDCGNLIEPAAESVEMMDMSRVVVAFRVKGDVRVYEGALIHVGGLDIAVRYEDDTVIGTNKERIEAVWFLTRWMDWEGFEALQ